VTCDLSIGKYFNLEPCDRRLPESLACFTGKMLPFLKLFITKPAPTKVFFSRGFLTSFCKYQSQLQKTDGLKTLILFDCDGTLTKPKGLIHPDMKKCVFEVTK